MLASAIPRLISTKFGKNRLLHEYGIHICLPPNFHVASFRTEGREIVDRIITDTKLPVTIAGVPQYKLAGLITDILNECNNKGIVLSHEYLSSGNNAWRPIKETILSLCMQAQEKIEQAKGARNTLTLNDLMAATLRLLKNEYVLSKLTETCRYLFIDEFQDTDKTQFEIVQILMTQGVNIFLIGDDQKAYVSDKPARHSQV